jgi:hypothetical protein
VITLALLAAAVIGSSALALWLRPWRRTAAAGLPWPWLALWVLLPLLWSPDRWSGVAVWPPASGAVLSVLLTGWPLTIVALALSAVLTVADGALSAGEVLVRWFWLGTVPATLCAVGGALLARSGAARGSANVLQLLIGRAFVGTMIAAGIASLGASQPPAAALLIGFAEAALTTGVVALLLLWRPGWVTGYQGSSD